MKFFVLPLLFFSQLLSAQIEFSRTEFDLGKISKINQDVVDVYIQNTTASAIHIKEIQTDEGITFTKTANYFPPSQPQILRFKINPSKVGKFKKKVTLQLSNHQPVTLTFLGNVRSLPKNNLTACPDFGSSGKYSAKASNFTQPRQTFIEILESKQEEIAMVESQETNPTQPKIKTVVLEDQKKEQERPADNKKTPEERRNSPSLLTTLFGNETQKEEQAEKVQLETTKVPIKGDNLTEVDSEENFSDNLLDNAYKPNNVVFLIDASTSMKQEERMDLLKSAMIELLKPLRNIDYLSIVTYSGDAEVLLPPTSAIEKEVITKSIENIIADGSTRAVKGIKKAIQVGNSNFLKEGNNQIILATDGAFDIGERNESLRRKIAQTAEDGLTITVLGIKNDNWTNKSLKEIAELGKGDLIKINSYKDSSKLLSEIKKKSLN
jgi:Mg-chelatase subunit ChlD